MQSQKLWTTLQTTLSQYGEDKVGRLAAALAYYTVLSLAPMLVIIVAVAGSVWGPQAVQGQIVGQIDTVVGHDAAELIETLIANASTGGGGLLATLIGTGTLLFGATTAFTQVQESLNQIWDIEEEEGGLVRTLTDRALAFLMVLGVALLLLVVLVISSLIPLLDNILPNFGGLTQWLLGGLNVVLSLAILAVVFAAMFRFLPDTHVEWGDVWLGAFVTAVLFVAGQLFISLYLGMSGTASTFGAAGSLVALLLWIYYSAQIFFTGAEFTAVYSEVYGSRAARQGDAAASGAQAGAAAAAPEPRRYAGHDTVGGTPTGIRTGTPPPQRQRSAPGLGFGLALAAALAVTAFVANAFRRDARRSS